MHGQNHFSEILLAFILVVTCSTRKYIAEEANCRHTELHETAGPTGEHIKKM
jgi:hypothetical protein